MAPHVQSLIFELVAQLCCQQALLLLCPASTFWLVKFVIGQVCVSYSDVPTAYLPCCKAFFVSDTMLRGILCQWVSHFVSLLMVVQAEDMLVAKANFYVE